MTETPESELPRILIVEDEALVARDIKSRLQQMGHTVAGVAHTPSQAIKMAEELLPGLLLCDIHLKDKIDGIDVAATITSDRDIPVIFLTAYSDRETVAKAKTITPYGYVLKPIETPDLQIAIEMAWHKFSIEQELHETRQLLATAMHCIGDALVFVDAVGRIANLNTEAEKLFGTHSTQAAGQAWQDLFRLQQQAGEYSTSQFLQTAIDTDAVTKLPPFSLVKSDGRQVLLDGIIGPTKKKGQPDGAVMMLRELAELHDPVQSLPRPTDLPPFDELSSFPQDSERAFVLLLLYPDHYEELTRSLDQQAKQLLLEEIGEELNQAMRGSDLATHYGDAVFSASLPSTSLDEASSIAEAVQQKLGVHGFLAGRMNLSFSVGMAHASPAALGGETESPLEIFRRANWALNLARQSGGDNVVIWRPSSDIDMIGELDRQSGLLAADSGRDYRNMVLLWNTMNTVASSSGVTDLASQLMVHFRKSFDLDRAGIFWQTKRGLQLIASDPALPQELIQDLKLEPLHLRLIEGTVSGSELSTEGFASDDTARCIPLYQRGECRGVLYVVCQQDEASLRHKDLSFMRTLLEYIAAPLAQQDSPGGHAAEEPAPVRLDSALLYNSASMTDVMEHVRLVAPTDATVLITGESGTGKELISQEIHRLSDRRDKPFVIVDCGAIVGTLIESELFGHTKGAFTGAEKASIGKLKEADGGTILLDEIGELAIDIQAKLLRVVQDKQFSSVGSNQVQSVDTRIIAATNVDLEASISRGEFREDLFYRLNVFTVHSPPLRERREDILVLANHFLQSCSRQYKKNIEGFSSEVEFALQNYHWPGNVRELRNRLIRAVILCQDSKIGLAQLDLPPTESPTATRESTDAATGGGEKAQVKTRQSVEETLRRALGEEVRHCLAADILPPLGQWLQEDLIQSSLELYQHINLQAAEALGIPESTLRRKAAQFLDREGEATRSAGWQAIASLLPTWILAAKDHHVDARQHMHDLLIDEISAHCQVQADAAMLAGVSPPTYRRQISQLKSTGQARTNKMAKISHN